MKNVSPYFTFAFLFTLSFAVTSCELFEDLFKETTKPARKDFIGLWQNDSLETKVYVNDAISGVTKQSLKGNTFEMRENGTYTTAGVNGTYLDGTWELLSRNNTYQILLDKGEALERIYDVKLISKNKLITNRKVAISGTVTEEYTFSYFR
jgi:hypothetical protein